MGFCEELTGLDFTKMTASCGAAWRFFFLAAGDQQPALRPNRIVVATYSGERAMRGQSRSRSV